MAVIRQENWLSQQRVDVPDLRAIESSVTNDFDILAGRILAGKQPLIIKGFTISVTGTLGFRADLLQLAVAGGLLMHFGASESGTIFQVPDAQAAEVLSATNTRVTGSFAANTTNYVGLDLRRAADGSTADSTKFLDANTKKEITKTVPKARILNYQLVISTQPFSAATNVAPVAKVVTDASNNVVSITDARSLMFRLGVGSDTPNGSSSFTWPDSSRTENTITFSGSSAADPFAGGDKGIGSFKQWMDALMTRLWEVGGGQYWYSNTNRDNVKLVYGEPVIVSSGDNFAWNSGTSTLTWKSISLLFENSPVFSNTVQDGSAVLNADGQCLYVDIQRGTAATIVPVVGTLTTLPAPTIPGSRFILAWRQGGLIQVRDRPYEVGRAFAAATTSTLGVVELLQTPGSSSNPVVLNLDANNSIGWTATGTNFTALTLIGNGTGAGGSFTGGGTSGMGVVGNGGGTGIGLFGVGGLNNAISGGPTASTATYGPAANGGVFLGGTGVQGGDGIQAFARASGSTKSGGYFAGNFPSASGVAGGFGIFCVGGDASANAAGGIGSNASGGVGVGGGNSGGSGGNFTGGAGSGGAGGGFGIVATGGASTSSTQTLAGYFAAGSGGGDGINALGVCANGVQRFGVVGLGGNATQSGDPGGGGVLGAGASAIGGNANGGPGIRGSGGGSSGAGRPGPGGTFANAQTSTGAVPTNAVELENGNLSLVGVANPNTNVGFTNTLTPKNIPKAWVQAHTNGSGAFIIDEAFNVTSVTTTGTNVVVTFAAAMNSNLYAAFISTNDLSFLNVQSKTTAACTFTVWSVLTSTGATQVFSDPSATFYTSVANRFVNIVIFAAQ